MAALASEPQIAEIASDVLKALGHPTRLRIVAMLCNDDLNVSEIAEIVGLQPAIVSQQLRILRMRGLVRTRRENGFALYSLAEPGLKNLVHCIESCTLCRWAPGTHGA